MKNKSVGEFNRLNRHNTEHCRQIFGGRSCGGCYRYLLPVTSDRVMIGLSDFFSVGTRVVRLVVPIGLVMVFEEFDVNETKIPAIDPEEEIHFMNIDETDFDSMTVPEQVRHFEVEGYVVLPGVLDTATIAQLKSELADAEMSHKSYSVYQTIGVKQPQWHSRAATELIGQPTVVQFLSHLMGPDIVFTRGFFQRTLPGSPGISMHTDGQPHGSDIFGFEGSSPRLLRVLYYLDELTPERAPFRVIPRSHLSFHQDASPYVRYKSHPGERTLCCPAGSAIIIPSMMFHATHPNKDPQPRELIQFGYRPAWAGPIQPLEEWDTELVAAAPEIAKPFLQSLNTTGVVWEQPHKPTKMKTDAVGIAPGRWEH